MRALAAHSHLTSIMFSHDHLLYHTILCLSSALLTIFRFFSPDTNPDKGKILKRTFDPAPGRTPPAGKLSFQIRSDPLPDPKQNLLSNNTRLDRRTSPVSAACHIICHEFLFCQIENRKKIEKKLHTASIATLSNVDVRGRERGSPPRRRRACSHRSGRRKEPAVQRQV